MGDNAGTHEGPQGRSRGAPVVQAEHVLEAPPEAPSTAIAVDESRLARSVLLLAWPVIAERFSFSLLAAVDGILVGRYVGEDGLAAVGLAGLLFGLPQTGIIGLELGTTTAASWDYGRGDRRRLAETLRTALGMALFWGLAATLVSLLLGGFALRAMGLDPAVRGEGVDYIRRAAPGLLGLSLFAVCAGALRGMGNSRFALYIMLLVNGLNALITWLLISGVAGVELGTAAGGWGFGISGLVGGGLALAAVFTGYGGLRVHPRRIFAIGGTSARRVLGQAVPVALEELQFLAAFLTYARIISSLGTEATAAHIVALRATDIAIVAVFGLGTATTALVGQAMGAGRIDLARRISFTAQRAAVIAMVALGLLQFAAAPSIASLFSSDSAVVDEAARALRTFAIAVPALGIYATVAGTLRGAGDVRFVLLILTVTAWGVRIPGAFVGAHILGFGLAGAWAAAVLEIHLRAALNFLRFRHGGWQQRRV